MRHNQCYHGDAHCSDWYSSKAATWRRTHWNGAVTHHIPDYTPSMCVCDNHEDKVWGVRYYEDDKNITNEGSEFFLVTGKPYLNQYSIEKPGWARRVDRAARKQALPRGSLPDMPTPMYD